MYKIAKRKGINRTNIYLKKTLKNIKNLLMTTTTTTVKTLRIMTTTTHLPNGFFFIKRQHQQQNDTVEPHNMNGSIDTFFRNYFQFSNILRYNASINLFSYKFCIAHTHTFRMKINEMLFSFFF